MIVPARLPGVHAIHLFPTGQDLRRQHSPVTARSQAQDLSCHWYRKFTILAALRSAESPRLQLPISIRRLVALAFFVVALLRLFIVY